MHRITSHSTRSGSRGFTLLETVIAIGVLAVLLTAFMAVFAPAADGIRRAISAQEADRLAYTLEKELVTLRDETEDYETGFDKAFFWIEQGNGAGGAPQEPLFLYQYRGDPADIRSQDGTMSPYRSQSDDVGVAGEDYVVQSMLRRSSDSLFEQDLEALEGRVYLVRLTQLVFRDGQLERVSEDGGEIRDPMNPNVAIDDPENYPEAVIAFAAEFFQVPNTSVDYITGTLDPSRLQRPLFTRNLAVRR